MNVIAILEDDERRLAAMEDVLEGLGLAQEAFFFSSAPEMIAWLEEHLPRVSMLCLDHDLGPTREDGTDPGDGRAVADWLAARPASCPVLLHTSNPIGRDGMRFALSGAGWTVDWVSPIDDLEWIRTAWIREVRKTVGMA